MASYDTSAYYAFAMPACVAAVATEVWLGRRRGLPRLALPQVLGNLTGGLGEVVVGLFLAPVLLGLYDFAYERFALVRWPEGSWMPWILAFVLGDLCYYWYHRAGHRFGAFWGVHGVHHQAEVFDFTVAMRHPWFSDTYSWPFYAPLPLLGVPRDLFFVAISAISFYALAVHTRAYRLPSFGVLVTPQSHIVHHARNPRYIGRNLGAMFCVWDKLFGTFAAVTPDDPPDVGPPGGYRSHDGARAQWSGFADMVAIGRAAGWRVGVRALIERPGWRPSGMVLPVAVAPAVPARAAGYALAWFVVCAALSVHVLWLREQHSWAYMVPTSAAVLWGLFGIGGVLDGRAGARRFEIVRCLGWIVLGACVAALPEYRAVGGGMIAAGLFGLGAARRVGQAAKGGKAATKSSGCEGR